MNKVYLLLRNNRESGPFTIDELIQQQLKSADLVWVEGKSVAWCYPYELDELKGHVEARPVLKIVPASNPSMTAVRGEMDARTSVFTTPSVAASYQVDEIEAKAEQIRSNIISYAQQNRMPYFRSTGSEPSSGGVWSNQESIQLIHHNRKKYVTLPQLIATGLITVLLASAWYGDWSAIKVKPNVVTMASAPAAFNEEKPQQPVLSSFAPVTDSVVTSQPVAIAGDKVWSSVNKTTNTTDSGNVSNASAEQLAASNTVLSTSAIVITSDETNAAETDPKKDAAAPPVDIKEPKKDSAGNQVKPQENEKQTAVEEKEERKKKLGQVIKGIFKKKNKEEE